VWEYLGNLKPREALEKLLALINKLKTKTKKNKATVKRPPNRLKQLYTQPFASCILHEHRVGLRTICGAAVGKYKTWRRYPVEAFVRGVNVQLPRLAWYAKSLRKQGGQVNMDNILKAERYLAKQEARLEANADNEVHNKKADGKKVDNMTPLEEMKADQARHLIRGVCIRAVCATLPPEPKKTKKRNIMGQILGSLNRDIEGLDDETLHTAINFTEAFMRENLVYAWPEYDD